MLRATVRTVVHHLAALACVAGFADYCAAAGVWEFSPYRVRLVLAARPGPELTAERLAELQSSLMARAATAVGGRWKVDTATPAAELALRMTDHLQVLSAEDAQAIGETEPLADKVIFLVVAVDHGRYSVSAREFDVYTRQFSAVQTGVTLSPHLLASTAFDAVWRAFAPLAQVEAVEDGQAKLRLRGAAIPVPEGGVAWTEPGDVFAPVLRINDRRGVVRSVQPIDWTYLTAQSVEGAIATARIDTGLRNPLTNRRRGRTEQLALTVRPTLADTRLRIVSRSDEARVLVGYDVYAHRPGERETTRLGVTDYRGEVVIPRDGPMVRVLLVKHGADVLARLPVLPGVSSAATAALPDDDRRLEVEGLIVGVQERFVDRVVRGRILAAQIRDRIENQQSDEAAALLAELRELEAGESYSLALRQQRDRSLVDDAAVQRKINRMFDDTQTLVDRLTAVPESAKLRAEISAAVDSTNETAP